MAMRLRRSGAVLVVLAAMSAVACTDKAKLSEKEANANVNALVAIADADVGRIERGLPLGAGKLSSLWANGADAHQDLRAVRAALVRMRREVPDLTIAKSTFFAVADAQGIAIRNDLEEDAMAGTALLPLFPGLAKAEAGSYVTTTGAFPGPPSRRARTRTGSPPSRSRKTTARSRGSSSRGGPSAASPITFRSSFSTTSRRRKGTRSCLSCT